MPKFHEKMGQAARGARPEPAHGRVVPTQIHTIEIGVDFDVVLEHPEYGSEKVHVRRGEKPPDDLRIRFAVEPAAGLAAVGWRIKAIQAVG